MIVALGGRPFTGKSTLARALAEALPGVLLDTAALRKVLFPNLVAAPPELNDWLYEGVLKAASWNLDTAPGTIIVLDGRPLTRNRDVLSLRRFASSLGHVLHIVECVCPDEVASARARSAAAGVPDPLPRPKDAGTDPIPEPKVVVDTCQPLERCVSTTLGAVSSPSRSGADSTLPESTHPT
ncbi:ATP-binding protein (plasmid) [Streptomyces sp. NBC_01216]|uniref:AAA family ATPase n=1 Tax=Streptomyces sp. NBC_01216 TaxID=2903778 RepID=UPI002E104B7B|nr:ATP-binding protein [Streptomyces sp. NBC_01216]